MKPLLTSTAIALVSVLYFITLSACAPLHDDGAGNLWKAVKYQERMRQ